MAKTLVRSWGPRTKNFGTGLQTDLTRSLVSSLAKATVDCNTSKYYAQYRKNSEKKPRGLHFSKASFEGLIFGGDFGGAFIQKGLCTEGNLRLKSCILGRKFTVFLCFTLCLRAISKYKPPERLIFGRAI